MPDSLPAVLLVKMRVSVLVAWELRHVRSLVGFVVVCLVASSSLNHAIGKDVSPEHAPGVSKATESGRVGNPPPPTSKPSAQRWVSREQSRLTALLDALELSRAGLQPVREAYENEDWERAATALVAYYRQRGVHSELLPEPSREPERSQRGAEGALKRIFYSQDVESAVPSGEHSLYDWEHKGPNADVEWAWFFNRHPVFRELYAHWQVDPNPEYPAVASDIVIDWVRHNPPPRFMSFSSAWRALEVARRLEAPWMDVFWGFMETPEFTDEARILMLASIPAHANYLMKHHAFGGNHKITEMMALLMVALVFPEFKESEMWLDYAVRKLEEELFNQTYPDGAHKELSNHYQRVVLLSFQRVLNLLKAGEQDGYYESMLPRVEAMWDYFVGVMRPIGWGPLNNDSDREDNQDYITRFAQPYYHRADWQYILTRQQEGQKPEGTASQFFPWAGHAVMRRDWSGSTPWAFYNIGPYGTDHQHKDRLHLSIDVGNRPFLVDSGRYTYKPGAARDYYQGGSGHNLVLLEGRASEPPPYAVESPMLVLAQVGDAYDTFAASVRFPAKPMKGQGSATHKRTVTFVKEGIEGASLGYWWVEDELISYGNEHWQTLWHFHPDCEIRLEGHTAITQFSQGVNLALIPFGFDAEVTVSRGSENPYQGWYSENFKQQRPATALIYETSARSPKTQRWLILPLAENESLPETDWILKNLKTSD